ncbi:alpha/beta hydrolase [Nocardioides sp. KIGAM211]|uniref:Alpha/beta hydrolase n=1 Tax=Nocardioides luti TaxID=2761101 RepID=A0A7X0VCL1_9ACTN|nr:alpha/beta hydrolase [Nocardioides luti]MBB6628333.1 alpha/beta hydrolase [Nocardioides luti]
MSNPAQHDQVTFRSGGADAAGGADCDAWHVRGVGDALATVAGRPCVVMAHGLAGTKDSGLAPFADALAAAGLDVLAFDYRGFGASGGLPRQTVSMTGQLEDYRAALAAAAALPGVDPQRLVLWGVSLAGGHVLAAAAGRDDVAAVVALTPLVDGLAAGRHALAHHTKRQMLRSTAAGVRGRVAQLRGRPDVMMPVVGHPGDTAALTLDGCYEAYHAIAGPTWQNEVSATVGLELGNHRPGRQAAGIRCPLLVQIADFDRSAPPYAAAKAAVKGRAEVRHYPCDHFDVYAGARWHDAVVAHQVRFLTRHLAPAPAGLPA